MEWNIRPDRPVYLQLVEQLELAVVTGEYPPGAKVLPVRELAAQAGVNPNTMQKALAALEAKGLVATHRTAGRTITEDETMLHALREEMALGQARAFCAAMGKLGLTPREIKALIEQCEKEGTDHGGNAEM